jgi:hypothetical protein
MGIGRRVAAVVAGGAVVALGLSVPVSGPVSGSGAGGNVADRPAALVYISGYDDHLLPAYETVPLYREPGGPAVADVPTDSLAWAHDEAGEWVEVSLAEGVPQRGWVADFFLRGELHLVDPATPGCPVPAGATAGVPDRQLDPSSKVRLVDVTSAGQQAWAQVRVVATGVTAWVERRTLSERPGPDARRLGPAAACDTIGPAPAEPHVHRPAPPQRVP